MEKIKALLFGTAAVVTQHIKNVKPRMLSPLVKPLRLSHHFAYTIEIRSFLNFLKLFYYWGHICSIDYIPYKIFTVNCITVTECSIIFIYKCV